jgi:Putative zinc-finger
MNQDGLRHPASALAEYAAGSSTGQERAAIEAHLAGCRSCRAELAGWAAVATAVAAAAAPPDPALVVRAALTRAALAPPAMPARRRGPRFAWRLLRAELRLVRPSVWLACALVMAFGVVLAASEGGDGAAMVLSLTAPLVAVAGIAGVYGPQRDPAFEVLAITATSPRLVLLARVTLVLAYDLALAVVATVVVGRDAPSVGLGELVTAWLGPMTLLSALSLVLALWIGPNVAVTVAAALWALRVLTVGGAAPLDGWLAAGMRVLWATNTGTVVATLVLVAVAVVLSRRPARPRGGPYRLAVTRAGR